MSNPCHGPVKVLLVIQFWLLLAVYAFLGLTGRPDAYLDTSHDLSLHFLGYGVLYLSAAAAYPASVPGRVMVPLLFGFSFAIEIGQHFVPGRFFDWRDLAANGCGLLLGAVISYCAGRYWRILRH